MIKILSSPVAPGNTHFDITDKTSPTDAHLSLTSHHFSAAGLWNRSAWGFTISMVLHHFTVQTSGLSYLCVPWLNTKFLPFLCAFDWFYARETTQ